MHRLFQHTAPRPTAQDHVLADDWSRFSAHFIQLMPISTLVGCILLLNQIFVKQFTVRRYCSDLFDQSALEIRVRIRVRLRVALF